jgi:AraC-like DNA-binding protein
MSKRRQLDPDERFILRTLAVDYASGTTLDAHTHEWDQLVYASRGVMTVRTAQGAWVVPSRRAVWVPAHVEHTIRMSGTVAMRTLYFRIGDARGMPVTCSVLQVSPLLRELALHAVSVGILDANVPAHVRLLGVIVDQLRADPVVPLQLSMPRDARALRVATYLDQNPGDARPLESLARRAGASDRTLERLFLAETGLTFGQWRQQLRLHAALRLLAAGEPVTTVAMDVGYESPSAFIAMFRQALGTTPRRYFPASRTHDLP